MGYEQLSRKPVCAFKQYLRLDLLGAKVMKMLAKIGEYTRVCSNTYITGKRMTLTRETSFWNSTLTVMLTVK